MSTLLPLKISRVVGIIARLRYFVPFSILIQMYRFLIFPCTYCTSLSEEDLYLTDTGSSANVLCG